MLRYTKTLSLALLFSLPAIAMENKEQALMVVNQAAPTSSFDMNSTLNLNATLDKVRAEREQLAKEQKDLAEREAQSQKRENQALTLLLTKQKEAEETLVGAKAAEAKADADLLASEQEESQIPQEIMDKAHLDIAKFRTDHAKAKRELQTKKEKAAAAIRQNVAALETIRAKLSEHNKPSAQTQQDAPKNSGLWNYFFGSSKKQS